MKSDEPHLKLYSLLRLLPEVVGSGLPLEVLLRSDYRVDLQTDTLDFLLVSGLCYEACPAYSRTTNPDLKAEARRRYETRRAKSDRGGQWAQTKLGFRLECGYRDGDFHSLRELKIWLRQHSIYNCGEGAMLYLSDILFKECGIEPFRILGARYYVNIHGSPPY